MRQRRHIEIPHDLPGGDLVIAPFFTSKPDPQRGTRQEGNFLSMRDWYFDLHASELQGLIVHDGLDPFMVGQRTTSHLKFLRCQIGPYSTNDERFMVYRDLLPSLGCDNVFLTDLFDVRINRDPFPLISRPGTLHLGSDEVPLIKNSRWMMRKMRTLEKETGAGWDKHWPLYNAGVIGGPKQVVSELLDEMCALLESADSGSNNNMAALQVASYRLSSRFDIESGHPLTSKFKAYEKSSTAAFTHK